MICLGGLPAGAHAILIKSTPVAGSTVDPGPLEISLRYNSRIDRERSRLTLVRAVHGVEIVPLSTDGSVDVLTGTVTLSPGDYTLRWQVLAIDGHITRGDVPFTVRKAAE